MKKHLIGRILAGSLVLALAAPTMPVFADSQKVVTLGADLSEEQRVAVLKYFGVYGQNIETIYITNQDERDHLSSYVPIEQIGSKTFSCALVCPTTSGGIHVKTANLSWVTSNMIASTLSTSGVVNCDVLAASPFEVSGTGALTGIMMAYETASGTQLEEEKKEIATQELVTTGTIANTVGQSQATQIVNEIKIQIIQGQVVDQGEVDNIVYSVVEDVAEENPESGTALSDEDYAMLSDLANQIAQQQYDYAEMEETLERVEENVESINQTVTEIQDDMQQGNEEIAEMEQAAPETLPEDSILMQTDDTALGTEVIIDATNEEALASVPEAGEEDMDPAGFDFDITAEDDYAENDLAGEDFAEGDYAEDDYSEEQNPKVPAEETWDELQQSGEEMSEGMEGFDEQPAEDVPGAELMLGRTEFSPASDASPDAVTGTQTIAYYVENADLMLQDGTLNVFDGSQMQIASIDLADPLCATACPMSADALNRLGWSEGTAFIVVLDDMLAPMQQYSIQIQGTTVSAWDQGSAQFEDNVTLFTGANGIHFGTYTIDDLRVGHTITGEVLLDAAQAASAQISAYDDTKISFDNQWFDAETTGFTATLLQSGEAAVTVDFFDAEGNYITSSNVTLTILD